MLLLATNENTTSSLITRPSQTKNLFGQKLKYRVDNNVIIFTKNTVTHISNIADTISELRNRIDDANYLLN